MMSAWAESRELIRLDCSRTFTLKDKVVRGRHWLLERFFILYHGATYEEQWLEAASEETAELNKASVRGATSSVPGVYGYNPHLYRSSPGPLPGSVNSWSRKRVACINSRPQGIGCMSSFQVQLIVLEKLETSWLWQFLLASLRHSEKKVFIS